MTVQIPFSANPDDSHCLQSCVRMVLGYFEPTKNYSWEQLDLLTGKREGCWTWKLFTIASLQSLGFDALLWEDVDYKQFSAEGESYLCERFGDGAAAEMISNSDIEFEIANAKSLFDTLSEPKAPSLDDVSALIAQGYLIICNIDLGRLNNLDSYLGHFVLVQSVGPSAVCIHDPGPPSMRNREVAREEFIAAWEFSSERDRNLIAVRLNKGSV